VVKPKPNQSAMSADQSKGKLAYGYQFARDAITRLEPVVG
jgi:hypothetical protein